MCRRGGFWLGPKAVRRLVSPGVFAVVRVIHRSGHTAFDKEQAPRFGHGPPPCFEPFSVENQTKIQLTKPRSRSEHQTTTNNFSKHITERGGVVDNSSWLFMCFTFVSISSYRRQTLRREIRETPACVAAAVEKKTLVQRTAALRPADGYYTLPVL